MKLSVILPVHNGEKFIKRAYNSIKAQRLEDYVHEIIFIDNNSTDDSAKVIKELMQSDPVVKLYEQPQKGEAHARNKGIEMAQGEYLHQLDVDDELFPGALRKMITVLDEYPEVEAVVGKMFKSHKPLSDIQMPTDETDEVIFHDKPYWGLKWFESLRYVVGEAAFLHRRSVFDKIGNYNVHISMGTDTAVDIKLGMLCNVAYINTYIYLYFKHFDSITAVSKRNYNQIFHLWSRSIHADLPLYLEYDVPLEYKSRLFRQLFTTMGKIIGYSKGFKNRNKIYRQIPSDISPVKLPFLIKLYLKFIVYIPLSIVTKFYVYYFSKWYVNRNLNRF